MHLFALAILSLAHGQDSNRSIAIPHSNDLAARMASLAEHEKVRLFVYGSSRDQKDLTALELRNGQAREGQPAMLLVAGLSKAQAWTSGLALDLVEDLLAAKIAPDTNLIVVPLANPDAYYARHAAPGVESEATGPGSDNDRDGRMGEDPGSDINQDGLVTWMRVPDPEGTWMADPSDERLNIEADPLKGESGLWKLVREGRDLDGDGDASEDGPLDGIMNRNFAARWEEHAARAGRYPTEDPQVRALCELVASRRDLQVVLVLGEQDNLVNKPKAISDDAPDSKRVPKTGLRQSDADRIQVLSERWKKATGYSAAEQAEDEDAGSFQAWAYEHRGLLTLCTLPWDLPKAEVSKPSAEEEKASAEPQDQSNPQAGDEKSMAPKGKPSGAALRLRWLEENGRTGAHLGWTAFDHPELGPVEIGGYRPFVQSDPWVQDIEGKSAGIATFLNELSSDLARIALTEVSATDLGGGLLDLRASVTNTGWLPLRSQWGQRTRTQRMPKLNLQLPKGAKLKAGRTQILGRDLDGGARQEFRWLVSGAQPSEIVLTVSTDHAGSASTSFEERL